MPALLLEGCLKDPSDWRPTAADRRQAAADCIIQELRSRTSPNLVRPLALHATSRILRADPGLEAEPGKKSAMKCPAHSCFNGRRVWSSAQCGLIYLKQAVDRSLPNARSTAKGALHERTGLLPRSQRSTVTIRLPCSSDGRYVSRHLRGVSRNAFRPSRDFFCVDERLVHQKNGYVFVDINAYERNVANVKSWCALNPAATVMAGLQRSTARQ